jgi:RNA polymerase sigma-70 factor (ECF subfamily)
MHEIDVSGDLLVLVTRPQALTVTEPAATSMEAALVASVRNGDREAFGRLYERYAPMVHGILLARAPTSEVDDLVQDVFLTAFKKIHTLREDGAFGGWLAMIARNRATDFHRRHQETEEMPEDLPQESTADVESDARARRILEAIRALPEAYSETLVLRLVEGMTGPEIAERTGLTPASVRVNLHRGMKMLRESIGMEAL